MDAIQGIQQQAASRILLVDDDAAVLKATRRVLERAGHVVVACSSGDDALVRLAGEAFDAMVSDIQMPGTTGLKLLRAVREHDLDLPVILVTGVPGVKSATDAVEYGAFRYLIKPVPVQELAALVSRAVGVPTLYLPDSPFAAVKLDMALVRNVHTTPTKQKIVRSMVRLCQDMGKQFIAEGVETALERDQLVELGCDLLQGYLFAKPGRPFPTLIN
jgi:DNA-binding NtrC family response regulator